jgi:oligopeptide transport system substrate-binding protein
MNPSNYKNPEFDRLMKEAETQADVKLRSEAMAQAERVLLADMPIVPVYHYTTQHLVSSKVTGWVDNVMDVHPSRYLGIK